MRHVGNRFFFDMDKNLLTSYLEGLFLPLKIWKEADTRSSVAPSPDNAWLRCIAKQIPL